MQMARNLAKNAMLETLKRCLKSSISLQVTGGRIQAAGARAPLPLLRDSRLASSAIITPLLESYSSSACELLFVCKIPFQPRSPYSRFRCPNLLVSVAATWMSDLLCL